MIIYGLKRTHLFSERISGLKCNYCNETRNHTISFIGRYFHAFWIPIFPLGKKGVSECNHCKVTYQKKQMSSQLKLAYENTKCKVKTPFVHWTGIIIISIFFLAPFLFLIFNRIINN